MKSAKPKAVKLTALIMAVSLTAAATSVSAAGACAPAENAAAADSAVELPPGGLTLEQLQTAELDDNDLPEAVSNKDAEQSGLVNRLYEQEPDLNTVVFQNRSGEKTAYMYSYPVKYIDESGEVQDKKSDLTEEAESGLTREYAYMSGSNDIKAHFPEQISEESGVMLKYSDICVETAPVYYSASEAETADAATAVSTVSGEAAEAETTQIQPANPEVSTDEINGKDKDSAVYEDVFGEGTRVKYTPQPEGYKESIILEENTGINEFSYNIKTGGLKLVPEGDELYLVDPETDTAKVSISKILVYDARVGDIDTYEPDEAELGEMNDGYDHHYEISTVTENSEYTITISVDPEYLNDARTQYPVVIDPTYNTMTYSYDSSVNNIIDVTLSKGKPDKCYGRTQRLTVGNYDKRYPDEAPKYGRCRALIALSTLKANLNFLDAPISMVKSARLYLKTIKNNTDSITIKASKMTGSWDELTVTANKVWDLRGANISSTAVTGTNWYSWDILSCVQDGINGNISSVMLCAANTTDKAKEFASCQNSDTTIRPYAKIEYTVPVKTITLNKTEATLYPGQTLQLTNSVTPSNASNKSVTYTSNNTAIATVSSSGLVTAGTTSGTATITATAADGSGKTASCKVTVQYYTVEQNYQINNIITTLINGIIVTVNNMPSYHNLRVQFYFNTYGNIVVRKQSIWSYYENANYAYEINIQSPSWIVIKNESGTYSSNAMLTNETNSIYSPNMIDYTDYKNEDIWIIPYDSNCHFTATFMVSAESIGDIIGFATPITVEVII